MIEIDDAPDLVDPVVIAAFEGWNDAAEAASSVVTHNQSRIGKTLWTQNHAGEPIDLFSAADDLEEAQFVAESIARRWSRRFRSAALVAGRRM